MTRKNNLEELLNQAQALIKTKNFDKALPIYEVILEKDSHHPKALAHLAIIYLMKERYIDAINMLHRSLKVTLPIIGDYHNLATAYNALKDYKNAIKAYEEIVKLDSNNLEIYKLLGDAQMKVVDYEGAINSYKKALEREPEKFQSIYDYGMILAQCLHHEEALKYLRTALKLEPDHLECMYLIGECLSSICNYEAAKIIYQKMMVLMPDAVGPHMCFASCLAFEGKYDEPLKILKNILIKKPNSHAARNNLGFLYMANKNFKEAWKYMDSRILIKNELDVTKRYEKLKNVIDLDVNKKELKKDEKIIILLDDGIGDVILALSMLKEFHKKFKNISAEVNYRLVDLCRRSFPDIQFYAIHENKHELNIDYDPSLFDKGIYWGSLGKYIRQEIVDFPKKEIGYLIPDLNKINTIKNKFKKRKSLICGISWKSSAQEGRHKTALLQDLLPIFEIKDLHFLDLQYEFKNNEGQTAIEKEKLLKKSDIKIDNYEDIDKFSDIDGLTALISSCDIIVTCSNVTAHIAGALGKKTFLFVPFQRGKLWYWLEEQGVSIWYPSIRMFTPESSNGWGKIFEKIAKKIKQELKL
ncbi:tetratricopeptide repeat protein [Methylophilaceae bacterium]|jgi:tetratricopeptide (TPR) repeat protein|nr:tetratricopeptide repeat protein [Methylophilaceae bacterium]|tara:strand:+ start:88 stop:1839 length:1752 start_codon:yes stop_codon:yes gene_type:complete